MIPERARLVARALPILALVVVACGKTPAELPPGFTVEDAQAFQRAHDEEIGAPVGPLSAVASYYVEPGQRLGLVLRGRDLVQQPVVDAAELAFEVTADGARCDRGCGPEPVAIEGSRTLAFDRFSLAVSRQSGTLRVVIHDPEAPPRRGFEGVPWFEIDPAFIVPARLVPESEPPTVQLATSRGLSKSFSRAGVLEAELRGETIRLAAYQMAEGAPLLVPLTDGTSGHQTYPVGRYLTVAMPEEGQTAVLDFNRLTNPWCAYSEHYNCPIPPRDNAVPLRLEAGEKTWGEH